MHYVALSGGADSVALLLKTIEQYPGEVCALHCNFHLRGEESNRDENFCRELCKQYDTELRVKHFDTIKYAQEHHLSIEMAARELRYEWFAQETDTILVAHHQDDQAETLLLHLLRGTGIKGLQGMKTESRLSINGKEICVLRPLLGMSKQEILDYLSEKGQDYVTDSTNLEADVLRNRIRLELLPLMQELNSKAKQHIAETATAVTQYVEGNRQNLLYEWFSPLGFNRTQIEQMYKSESKNNVSTFQSATHRALYNKGTWEVELIHKHRELKLDADKAGSPLSYRLLQDGDRFRPFGMRKGSKLIKDFLSQRGYTLLERERQYVALNPKGEIVAVLGVEIDDRYRITEQTLNVLHL